MKRVTLFILAFLITAVTFSQKVLKEVDDMTGKTQYYTDDLILANETKTTGFRIQPYFDLEKMVISNLIINTFITFNTNTN